MMRQATPKVLSDGEGTLYCAVHESKQGPVMLMLHPQTLSDECPFCWFEAQPGHACADSKCYCRLVREAVKTGTVWTKRSGRP